MHERDFGLRILFFDEDLEQFDHIKPLEPGPAKATVVQVVAVDVDDRSQGNPSGD